MVNFKFKVGDKVKRVSGGSNWRHEVGSVDVVTRLYKIGTDLGFFARDNKDSWCDQRYYELYEDREEIPQFKCGDKVRVVRTGESYRDGFQNSWVSPAMDAYVNDGLVYEVGAEQNEFGVLLAPADFRFPPQSLELVTDTVVSSEQSSLGAKFDAGKLLFRPLMRGLALPLRAVAAVLTYGAQKYAEDSWQHVPDAKKRYEDAYYRHINARESGEVYDPESGLPHRAHELCNIMFLLWFDIKDGTVQNYTKFNTPPSES